MCRRCNLSGPQKEFTFKLDDYQPTNPDEPEGNCLARVIGFENGQLIENQPEVRMLLFSKEEIEKFRKTSIDNKLL